MLCQTGSVTVSQVKAQLQCEKDYIYCWNARRQRQLIEGSPYDGDEFLSDCILEKNIK